MSDHLVDAYESALAALLRGGPKPLHPVASVLGSGTDFTDGGALLAYLRDAGPEDSLRQSFAQALATWDHTETDAAWAAGTRPNTRERRHAVTSTLDLDEVTAALFDELFPYAASDKPIVITDQWSEWRTEQRRKSRDFYWAHYRRYLIDKGWPPQAVVALDEATEHVVRRLADPVQESAYQAKGLVVGYVQSGKTANFTGVAAKAIDAGYRLLIVLTGTTNMLRSQTQRRLDMELCGRENLEREISPYDSTGHDYHDDPDWTADKFLRHGLRPSDAGYPEIRRLTNRSWDYKALKQGFSALEFERREPTRPFFDPANLFPSNARLVVAKKNSGVLKNLVADLGRISDRLGEIPVLIIDDESDQASINTISPAKWREGNKERTAINKHIGNLLRMMPRAQYVGYTATPYANVLIDPSDAEDIFPRDFIVSLPRPVGYMGADDFHDSEDESPSDESPHTKSGKQHHVVFLDDEASHQELQHALDLFVLTGAVKLYRQRHGVATYRHHTMLVHEASKKETHHDTAALLTSLWRKSGYYLPTGLDRLRGVYRRDILEVSRAMASDLPTPGEFKDLLPDLSAALKLIVPADRDASPVIVVNSDQDLDRNQESLDFDKRRVWRILVGGNKLARGFTVEGLTITYYRRKTGSLDTLMQMGRWFGFRPGYRDLVRLLTTHELYAMFEAASRDEEFLRNELRKYANPVDGSPQFTPRTVPPLIAQHRPDLRPTGRNKMWNARLVEKRSPGQPMEPVAYPTSSAMLTANLRAWEPILEAAVQVRTFRVPGARTTWDAWTAVVRHQQLLDVLKQLKWMAPDTFKPELAWLSSLTDEQLARWLVLLPHQSRNNSRRTLLGHGPFSIFERRRTNTGALSAISEPRHRNAAARIAGLATAYADPEADRLSLPATGAVILYPSLEKKDLIGVEGGPIDPGSIALAFHMITPMSSAPRDKDLIKWVTIDNTNTNALVIDAPVAPAAARQCP
jgi:hypothetical protein